MTSTPRCEPHDTDIQCLYLWSENKKKYRQRKGENKLRDRSECRGGKGGDLARVCFCYDRQFL